MSNDQDVLDEIEIEINRDLVLIRSLNESVSANASNDCFDTIDRVTSNIAGCWCIEADRQTRNRC